MNEYIKNLTKNFPERKKPLELDLVIEGGAYNGYYGLGSLLLLKELEKQNYVIINRISGSSVGALFGTAFFFDKLDEIAGRLWGIKGQYLMFDDGSVLNIRNHNGYNVTLEV